MTDTILTIVVSIFVYVCGVLTGWNLRRQLTIRDIRKMEKEANL
jgi:hypothetical protein